MAGVTGARVVIKRFGPTDYGYTKSVSRLRQRSNNPSAPRLSQGTAYVYCVSTLSPLPQQRAARPLTTARLEDCRLAFATPKAMLYPTLRNLTLVVVAGVLVGCSGSKDVIRRQQDEIAELRVQNERLRNELERSGMKLPARSTTSACGNGECVGETITVLLTDLYFESGSAALNADGVARLASVADEIRASYRGRNLRVEGHTDSNPIGPALKVTYPSNWELSAARAASVVRHLQWTHKMSPDRFEVVGFGPYAPVATNDTEKGRRENRRVRIAVLPE